MDHKISFTIPGQPVPYLRMTQRQVKLLRIPRHKLSSSQLKVVDKIKRYFDWKRYVESFLYGTDFDRKPKEKVYLNVMIYFPNKKHADPENIRKGIQDSIFVDDKYVAGSVDFDYDKDNPRCEIEIVKPQGQMCKITGSEISFEMNVPFADIVDTVKEIWGNPEKYSGHKNGSDAAYYSFLKYLWIEFPDGKEEQLAKFVNDKTQEELK